MVLAAWLGLSQAWLAVDTQQGPVVGRARREFDTRTQSHVSWTEFPVGQQGPHTFQKLLYYC